MRKKSPKSLFNLLFESISSWYLLTTYQNTKTWVSGDITKSAITIDLMHFFFVLDKIYMLCKKHLNYFFLFFFTDQQQSKEAVKKEIQSSEESS